MRYSLTRGFSYCNLAAAYDDIIKLSPCADAIRPLLTAVVFAG